MLTPIGVLDDTAEMAAFTRWETRAGGQRTAESALRIQGMHCAACAPTVERALRATRGVIDARVSAAAQCATVRWDPAATRVSLLLAAVEASGYRALPDTAAASRNARQAEARTALWRLFVAGFCAMQIMMLATPAYVSAPGELPADQKQLLDWGSWLLTLPVLWFSAAPFFAGAWRALRARRIGMDVPVALGIAVAFIASSGAAFDPGGTFGHEVWFDSLAMFVSFLLGGRYLEMQARHRAERALEDSCQRLPAAALRVAADGSVESVSLHRLVPGDRVRVPVGQSFAADGVLLEGVTAADESLLTGESRPVAKRPGDALVAGSLNLQAPVLMRVDRVGADTRHEAIVAMMRAARTQRPTLLATADRWAAPFLWGVLLLAGLAAAAWSQIDPGRVWWVLVSVLIVTCPCALSLAAPSALIAAAGTMSRRGLLLRRLDAIQGLARLQTLFIDKTGTLTEGALVCSGVDRLVDGGPHDAASLQRIAASLAAWSSHPLAQALQGPGSGAQGSEHAWRDVHEQPGQGLEARDAEGRCWRLGSARWTGGDADAQDERVSTWLACDGRALARLRFDERLRDDAIAAVHALQADGVQVRLLSGDAPARVRQVAAQLGLAAGTDSALGGLAPDEKLAAIAAAQQRGEIVAMLGDGINDAPVIARADVSIAMGAGSALTRTQADGVLVSNRLQDLVHARGIARRALRVVQQNLAWAAAYNATCIPLALLGWLPPWAAGLGMAASSLFVVLNSLRLTR
ncbi:heavy metal translocating P-type ATPase [Aquabacterium sp.]|uniref:heavy metal translocating P-type ATPase n=1 Tax=Aquabacterium sp. TaxID=1872578 RepID=UPI002B76A6A7|nr:cation-translocating P-type ATPase [Aquabacterium sp.]HSW05926.1 cation-translocating P-type ATPase [Aquabacterium sp.]